MKGDVGKGAYGAEEDNANSLFLGEVAFRRKVLCHERSPCSCRSLSVRSPSGLTEPSPARALILPRDLMSHRGCESKLLWSFRLRLRRRPWLRGAPAGAGRGAAAPGCLSPWDLQAQLPAMRFLPGAVGSAAALRGLPSPSRAVHVASKPGTAGSRHRVGRSGIPSPAGREARRGLCSWQSS